MVRRLLLTTAAIVPLLAAPAAASDPAASRPFGSCAALVRYASAHTPALGPGARGPLAAPKADADPEASPGDASTTNVQEAGVDEADVVKSDGTTLFAIAGGVLRAVDARAAAPRLVGSLALPVGGDHQLLVAGGRGLVISQGPFGVRPLAGKRAGGREILPQRPPTTVLTEIDLHDPSAMRVVRTERFAGRPVSARLTGASARIVVASSPPALTLPSARRKAAGWVPTATLSRHAGSPRTQRLVDCRQVRRPAAFSGGGLLSILTVDLARGLPAVDADALMTDADAVYASPASLYVTSRRVDASAAAATTIHQFDTSAPDRTTYRAAGSVPGELLGSFALSEQDGVLRVASTTDADGAGSESRITTLRSAGGRLDPVGRVTGLGPGERIQAVRFVGPVGYVVTFRQTDPLYTVDLRDPAAPRVAGELRLRGYSAYLHPIGDGLLLGVGQDATEDGRTTGAQLSLFDVADPARPVRLQQQPLGAGSSSTVEWDHHAFLWWPATQLAVLPLASERAAGAPGFRVDRAGGILPVGRLEHGDAEVLRIAVVGDRLLGVTDGGVQVAALSTLAPQAWVPFPAEQTPR